MMKDNMESKDSSDVVYIKISYELSFYIEKIILPKNQHLELVFDQNKKFIFQLKENNV